MNRTTLRVSPDPIRNLPELPALKRLPGIPPFAKNPVLMVLPGMIGNKLNEWKRSLESWMLFLLIILLLAIWFIPSASIHSIDPMAIAPDPADWLMVILSMNTFLIMVALCWWLLGFYWRLAGLPSITEMVLHFNLFTKCQQLVFYYLSFALLLLAAVGCLIAIC